MELRRISHNAARKRSKFRLRNGRKITEIVDRREENVKHFRMADGSVRAISYGCAVHRKDENGIWQDIDNRLYSANDGTYSTVENRI